MIAGFFLIALAIVLIPSSFSLETEIRSVTITSKKLSYEQKEPGSWNIEKSAEWTSKGKARITFDVDTVLKTENAYTDIILVLDVSGSMEGEKLDRVKQDSKELVNSLLSNPDNRVALITFSTTSSLVSGLTNDKDGILNQIDDLTDLDNTNYYQPLINVDEILKDYQKEENRECIVLFLTDGYPNEDIPNQIAEYSYLKKQYPYLTINGIQYEMGSSILEPIKEISDYQFLADMESLNNVLFEASVTPIPYSSFTITDYLDSNYFEIENIANIQVSQGKVNLEYENGVPKVTWNLNNFKSGSSAQMTIDVNLKEEYLEKSGYYPTNQKEEVTSQIEDVEENITSQETPILKTPNEVLYESNTPEGCQVENVPENERKWAKEIVEISEEEPSCEGYQFKGWQIVTEGVKRINEDYFEMPGKDVILRAEWGKVGLSKTMDGEVYVAPPPVMQVVGSYNYNEKLWKYKDKITKIIFQDELKPIQGANIESWDISEAEDRSVMAYYDKENTTAYIQVNEKITANPNSSYLFYDFKKLTEIEGLELLDTSNVTDMSYMFQYCYELTALNLSEWNTSKVTNMNRMFCGCSQLISLNLSKWDTSSVTNMSDMFNSATGEIIVENWKLGKNLSDLFEEFEGTSIKGLETWDTSSVTNMDSMFYYCSNLTTLDLSSWDTSKVTNMDHMFYYCSQLTSLDLSDWDISKVTIYNNMFNKTTGEIIVENWKLGTNLSKLFYYFEGTSIKGLETWNTLSVTNMSQMFYHCSQLVSLDLSNWNITNVTECSSMFESVMGEIIVTNWELRTDISGLFKYFNGTSIKGLETWDTSHVTNMDSMFYYCSNLTNLDSIKDWNTSSVTNMSDMFDNCKQLTSLNLSGWDTSKVKDMNYMFYNCSNLTSVGDLSKWDTSKVTDMSWMFDGCSQLTSLDLSDWKTSSVTNMSDMFNGCSQLTSLDLSKWDTSSVTNMSDMFNGCSQLTSLDLSKWDTSSVTNMSYMFYNCSKLTSLDLSGWDTSSVTNMSYMFSSVTGEIIVENWKLGTNLSYLFYGFKGTSIKGLETWDTSSVTNMSYMFYNCSKLTSLDLSGWDTSSVINMKNMFQSCSQLTSLNLSGWDITNVTKCDSMFSSVVGEIIVTNWKLGIDLSNLFKGFKGASIKGLETWDTSSITNMNSMFSSCSNLTNLDLSGWDTSKVTNMSNMFYSCSNLTTTINITMLPSVMKNYTSMFSWAATATDAKITVNYTSENKNLVDEMIETKLLNSSHVELGKDISTIPEEE